MGDIGKLAMMIGIIITGCVFLFCIIVAALEKMKRQKFKVEQRISGLTYEKAESDKTKDKKRSRRKGS